MITNFSNFTDNITAHGYLAACYISLAFLFTVHTFAQNLTSVEEKISKKDQQNLIKSSSNKKIEKITQRGPVKTEVKLEPSEPTIGDVLTLTLQVSAEAEVELLMPEFGQSLERFTILDFVPREVIDDQGKTIVTYRYRLQTSGSGPQSIPPLMIEFVDRRPGNRLAPEGEDAYEILTERIEFNVKSVVPSGAAKELKAPLGKLKPLGSIRTPIWIAIVGLGILLIGLPFLLRLWQQHRIGKRRRSAYDIANSRLSRLRSRPKPREEEIGIFFVELSDIVRRYLEDRFNLHAPELTTEEFLEVAATSPDLTSEHKSFLQEFLRQADQVKFAQHIPDAHSIDKALSSATNFLEQTKQDAPLLEEPVESQKKGNGDRSLQSDHSVVATDESTSTVSEQKRQNNG